MAITEEDIKLMSDEANKDTFAQCKPALDAIKTEKDPAKQKELAKTILQNFVKEKTIYILKTNDLTKNVMAQLSDKIGEITDLDSFLKVAQEKPEALAELKKIAGEEVKSEAPASADSSPTEGQQTGSDAPADSGDAKTEEAPSDSKNDNVVGTTGDDEGEEDPWIRSALAKLRSQKLY